MAALSIDHAPQGDPAHGSPKGQRVDPATGGKPTQHTEDLLVLRAEVGGMGVTVEQVTQVQTAPLGQTPAPLEGAHHRELHGHAMGIAWGGLEQVEKALPAPVFGGLGCRRSDPLEPAPDCLRGRFLAPQPGLDGGLPCRPDRPPPRACRHNPPGSRRSRRPPHGGHAGRSGHAEHRPCRRHLAPATGSAGSRRPCRCDRAR